MGGVVGMAEIVPLLLVSLVCIGLIFEYALLRRLLSQIVQAWDRDDEVAFLRALNVARRIIYGLRKEDP